MSKFSDAPLAQLDRVLGYEPRGQGFESLVARHGIRRFAVCYSGSIRYFSVSQPLIPAKLR